MKLNIIELCKKISEYVGYEVTYLTNMSEYREYAEVSICIVSKENDYGEKTLTDDFLLKIDAGMNSFGMIVVNNSNEDLSEQIADFVDNLDVDFDIEDEDSLYAKQTF